jgi:hypothetical protein
LVFFFDYREGVDDWASLIDFTKLRCLHLPWNHDDMLALARMATNGSFDSLRTLKLHNIEHDQELVRRFLNHLKPLNYLDIDGYIDERVLDVILRRHGEALYGLRISPYACSYYKPYDFPFPFTEPVVQKLVEHCPRVEHLDIPIARTRGDAQEIGNYRVPSRLPRLKRLFLRLGYWIGPYEQLWGEERLSFSVSPGGFH